MLRLDMVKVSDKKKPSNSEINSKGFIYSCSGMSNAHNSKGIATGIRIELQLFIVEFTPISKNIKQLRLRNREALCLLLQCTLLLRYMKHNRSSTANSIQ